MTDQEQNENLLFLAHMMLVANRMTALAKTAKRNPNKRGEEFLIRLAQMEKAVNDMKNLGSQVSDIEGSKPPKLEVGNRLMEVAKQKQVEDKIVGTMTQLANGEKVTDG